MNNKASWRYDSIQPLEQSIPIVLAAWALTIQPLQINPRSTIPMQTSDLSLTDIFLRQNHNSRLFLSLNIEQ